MCSRCLNPRFKINVPLFCCPLFFNSQVRTKKMANIVTYYLSPLGLPLIIHPLIFLQNLLGFILSTNFKFSHKRVYSTMVMKNVQVYGVQISGKWNYKSQNLKQTFLPPQGITLSPVHIITPKAETNYSFPPVKGEDYENLFQNVML